MYKIVAFLVSLFISCSCWAIDLWLPAIFADQMVLQRDQEVPVWGKTAPGATVELTFAGQQLATVAANDGSWKMILSPMAASAQSRTMSVVAKLNGDGVKLTIDDVLVGEVWFCGGQSNMYRPFRMLTGEAAEPQYEPVADYLRQEAASANDILFRQFRVGRAQSVFEPKSEGRGNWSKAIAGEVNEFCGTAYFFGRELRRELNVPVALISCNLGGTRIEPWMPINAFDKDSALQSFYRNEINSINQKLASYDEEIENKIYQQLRAEWEKCTKEAKKVGVKIPNEPRKPEHPAQDKQVPATLYNGMMHPLIPYAVKGAIWYQGESNTGNWPEEYGKRLITMVEAWREAWGQNDFYFYCCQLANYKEPNDLPTDQDDWATVQFQQSRILQLENTGLAVLNDIGEARDIHPKNKIDAGKRISLWALKQAYGKDIVCCGPLYKCSEVKAGKMLITFDRVGSGLMVGRKQLMEPVVPVDEPLARFQICGVDGVWKWAEAKIISKDQVEVWHPSIANPTEVRYAWSSNPKGANLYNREGLPASLFKTK
ncbi:sialate O-acetylesterase [Mangrovibacterium sp.]|uniref:sialate O-acetylesterase n=1 Tax=Mangrovibacterium sp. TaxID=1961364 RepID=UPI00356A1D36